MFIIAFNFSTRVIIIKQLLTLIFFDITKHTILFFIVTPHWHPLKNKFLTIKAKYNVIEPYYMDKSASKW